MDSRTVVFLSHSSKDRELADVLARQIEQATGLAGGVFVSSRPTAIESGTTWFDRIIAKLDEAEVLLILLTPGTQNSIWIGFEFGYWWKKKRSNVHILYHPSAPIPAPLDMVQGKLVTDPVQVENVLNQIRKGLGEPAGSRAEATEVVRVAQMMSMPAPERTFQRFAELLDHAKWLKGFIDKQEVWTCEDDVLYQIAIGMDGDEFDEEWTRGFPDPTCSRLPVYLKVDGAVVRELTFVSLDGGRYFVPLPEIRTVSPEERSFYWDTTSLEFRVGRLVGHLHLQDETLETFANKRGIEIIQGSDDINPGQR